MYSLSSDICIRFTSWFKSSTLLGISGISGQDWWTEKQNNITTIWSYSGDYDSTTCVSHAYHSDKLNHLSVASPEKYRC